MVEPGGMSPNGSTDSQTVEVSDSKVKEATSSGHIFSPGTHLGSYEIVSRIGAGGMGEVYRARDPKLQRDVAIKVLAPSLSDDPEALARFEREALAVAALSHPNILSIFDFGREKGAAYAVTELLAGETLREKLKSGPIDRLVGLEYALQILQGLSAAHEKGIVHRDLKPENLFVTVDGRVKILDFGLAKRNAAVAPGKETSAPTVTGHTTPGAVMGTLGYMSPEQLRGLPVDQRSDLFSFGIVMYELATGTAPFRGNSPIAVADAILHAEPPSFGDVPVSEKWKQIIRRLLAKAPERRYATAHEVRERLREIQADIDPARRRLPRGVRILLAAAGVAVLALGVWLWRNATRERWALGVAAPEIAKRLEAGKVLEAASLAKQARDVLPKDPTLEKLWLKATGEVSLETVPAGAEVSIRPYASRSVSWQLLGKTPLKTRVADDAFVWRVTKPGFATMYLLAGPGPWKVTLHPQKEAPPDMVPVAGDTVRLAHPFSGAPKAAVGDFWIDSHEVTNAEYKRFVDAGGYGRPEFWKTPFARDGRTLTFAEAIDAFRDTTGRPGPATWEAGSFRSGEEMLPVSGVSWYEASAYAESVGKTLPTAYHWTRASQADLAPWIIPGSHFRAKTPRPVGSPGSLSGFGTTDMAGNVKEWCSNEGKAGSRFIMGGGFGEPSYMFIQPDAQPPWRRLANYGFRCVKLSGPPSAEAVARIEPRFRDFSKETPVPDDAFAVYKRLYFYEKTDLDARIEETQKTREWVRQKVSFNAAYGNERVIAHLYMPTNSAPPYQTVFYFPGANAMYEEKFDTSEIDDVVAFLPKSGRAVLFPVLKSTFERRDGYKPPSWTPSLFRDHAFMWAKDVFRSVDYLETRKDIDAARLAYLGASWGGSMAPIVLAVENRFRAAILTSGGLQLRDELPESDGFQFAPHVRLPVLMLNGRLDDYFPFESAAMPLFHLLGTQPADKHLVAFEAGHMGLPRPDEIRETLDWLDRYLGPVRR